MIGELRSAWSRFEVKLGLVGTLLITLGSLTPAYLPQASPIWGFLRWASLTGTLPKVIGTLLVLVGLLLLIEGWFRLRTDRELRHWAVLAIWALPFILAPPIFSHDAYSYAAHGWLLHNGLDPYEVGPGVLPGAFADQVAWVWRNTTTPYGPLSLRISQLLCWLTGFDPFLSALAMRIPAILGVGLIGYFLPKIAEIRGNDVHFVGWMGILNPVLVIDFIGGAHNDALMVGLIVFAIWLTARTKWWLVGAVVIGVAASIKQPALLAGVALPFLVYPWSNWRRKDVSVAALRLVASLVVSIGTFALVSIATRLGFGWYYAVNVPGKVITVSPFTVAGRSIQWIIGLFAPSLDTTIVLTSARVLGMATSVVIIGYLALRYLGKRPIFFTAWSYIAVALCAPAFHSWYVLWGGVLVPLTNPRERTIRYAVLATLVMLCYAAINLSNRNESLALGVAIVGAVFWLLHTHNRKLREVAA